MKTRHLYLLSAFVSLIFFTSCKKENAVPETPKYPIAGLWIGTYTFLTQPPLYFSFTIYPEGTMSYKGTGINNYIFYANGTWTLSGNSFKYTVVTTNTPNVEAQPTQTGTATYSDTGTLTNGENTDVATGLSGTFSMTRIN